jgi:hypothetical protein
VLPAVPRALEDLDSLLLRASRNDTSISVETMRGKISVALAALDKYYRIYETFLLPRTNTIRR